MITGKLITLSIHNILRWVIVGLGFVAIFKMYWGWFGKNDWKKSDSLANMFFTIALDTQLFLGFLLYFIFSDITKLAFINFGDALANPVLRFFSVEHAGFMIIAIIIAHLANATSKKEISENEKFKRNAILLTISFILIMIAIPWSTRPLFPDLF